MVHEVIIANPFFEDRTLFDAVCPECNKQLQIVRSCRIREKFHESYHLLNIEKQSHSGC